MEQGSIVSQAATNVWWDFDACPPPRDCDCLWVGAYMKQALNGMGFSGLPTIHAFGNEELLDKRDLQALRSSAVRFVYHTNGSGALNMKTGMRRLSEQKFLPMNHLIITKDFEYYLPEVSALKLPGCSILLAYPDGDKAAESAAKNFSPIPTYVWNFSELMRGGPPDDCKLEVVPDLPEDEVDFVIHMLKLTCFNLDFNLLCDANTSVWWDTDTCPVPIQRDAAAIPDSIATVLGYRRDLTIFADTSSVALPTCACATRNISSNFCLPVWYSSKEMMLVVREWAQRNPPPAICFLISGDENYGSVLDELRTKGYEILLAHSDGAREGLLASKASCVWDWSDLCHGESPYRGSPSPLPTIYEYKYSLKYPPIGDDSDSETKGEDLLETESERKRCRTSDMLLCA
ncbi:hypothetical protein OROMI_008460 [Orobanche minor]